MDQEFSLKVTGGERDQLGRTSTVPLPNEGLPQGEETPRLFNPRLKFLRCLIIWPPVRPRTSYIFEVNTENLGYAPGLSNASARAMGRVPFEISEI